METDKWLLGRKGKLAVKMKNPLDKRGVMTYNRDRKRAYQQTVCSHCFELKKI